LWRNIVVIAILAAFAGLLMRHSPWFSAAPAILFIGLLVVAALPYKGRTITPQEWADELEGHLLGNEGAHDWDDATSIKLADERLERIRGHLIPGFDRLDTPEKVEELRRIVEALRRGEAPSV
jgi:hypothetical protein